MADEPPIQPGQLSPDGMWRWEGQQWVPTMAVAPATPQRSRAWIWWLAGGCSLVLVLALVGAGFGLYGLAKGFQNGSFECLPSDFPSYPGATVTTQNTRFGSGVAPGDSKSCMTTLESNDDVATVAAFYNEKLAGGDWKVTAFVTSVGQIQFQRVSRPATVGVVQLLGRGQHTVITIQLDS